MFCIVAFVVLSILGIFSASNRELAREALDCVFRRVTLRPCNTGFDEKMKARLLGSVITRSETAARLLNRNFELLSWTFFVLMLASSIWSVRGIFLFYTFGSCNGANDSSFCVFDPSGSANATSAVSGQCRAKPATPQDLTLKDVDLSGMPVKNTSGKDAIIMFGCYHCDFTREVYPSIRALVQKFNVNFTYFNYPTKENTDYFTRLGYCVYQKNPEQFWKLNDVLFSTDKTTLDPPKTLIPQASGQGPEANEEFIRQALVKIGADPDQTLACVAQPGTEEVVKKQMAEVVKTQFYGTPTIFINGSPLVGPKPYRVYAILLKGLFYWLY